MVVEGSNVDIYIVWAIHKIKLKTMITSTPSTVLLCGAIIFNIEKLYVSLHREVNIFFLLNLSGIEKCNSPTTICEPSGCGR